MTKTKLTIDGYPYEVCTDSELLHERKQIKVSVSCGPGQTALDAMKEKIIAINTELARREKLVTDTKERIARQQRQHVRDLTRRYVEMHLIGMITGDADVPTSVAVLGAVLSSDEEMRHLVREEISAIMREVRAGGPK